MLRAWLLRPLARSEPILDRLDAVEELAFENTTRSKLRDVLSGVYDLERLVARVVLGTAGPRDLVTLAASVGVIPSVRALGAELRAPLVRSLVDGLDDVGDVRDEIRTTLVDEPPALVRDGGAIRDGVDAELDARTAFLMERLAADRLLPYGSLGAAMGGESVRAAEALVRCAVREAGGRPQPRRLVYREGHRHVAGNVTVTVTADRSRHVLIMPAELRKRPQHRLDVWIRATFAAACGLRCDTLVVSRDGEDARVDCMPPIATERARAAFDLLLRLYREARRRPLPFGPKTSFAIYDAGRRCKDDEAPARKAWEQQPKGPPGEGDSASAQLAWRDRDPFAEETFDEWRGLAAAVFSPLETWFATGARDGAADG